MDKKISELLNTEFVATDYYIVSRLVGTEYYNYRVLGSVLQGELKPLIILRVEELIHEMLTD